MKRRKKKGPSILEPRFRADEAAHYLGGEENFLRLVETEWLSPSGSDIMGEFYFQCDLDRLVDRVVADGWPPRPKPYYVNGHVIYGSLIEAAKRYPNLLSNYRSPEFGWSSANHSPSTVPAIWRPHQK